MDLENRLEVECIKREVHALEREEEEMKARLNTIRMRKDDLLKKIEKFSDEQYEQNALERLYEQRRGR